MDTDGEAGVIVVTPRAQRCVVLDRVADVTEPDYCVHGQTPCIVCAAWCLLGPQSFVAVSNGDVLPICMRCASALLRPESRVGNLDDLLHP